MLCSRTSCSGTTGGQNHRYYYSKVERIERPDERTIKFIFKPDGDREMPLILGLMPILPKHIYDAESFERIPPSLRRWGAGLTWLGTWMSVSGSATGAIPIIGAKTWRQMSGGHNFELIRYDYYRDANAAFEAFKKGLIDMRGEGDPTRWATGYDFPALKEGRVVREEFATGLPSGMSAFVFNTRREILF